MTKKYPKPQRPLALLGGLAVLLAASLGADVPTKPLKVGELSFDAPTAWKQVRPRSAMIQLQFSIDPVEGDTDPAELTISAISGGGGSLEANLARWQGQFKDENGKVPPLEKKTVKGKNVEATRAELAGHYYPPPFTRLPDKPNYRLLGAIVQTGEAGYYLKIVGPDKTVKAARPAFDQTIASIKAEGK